MALVFVLWVMMILCAVALDVNFSTHLRLQVTANTGGATKARFLARAGVERAIADLLESRDRVQAAADLREGDERAYQNVELGEGSYTLYAGTTDDGDPAYGIADESAKLNLNRADAETLAKVPGMSSELAAVVVAWREHEEYHDVDDLLLLEEVDRLTLHGEDQNGNGLLDANEDDGDQSWPPDNADGRLDEGLAAYLTTWSAARNVTAEGEKRVNLNSADADELSKSVPGLTAQQADSIVARREKNKFGSITDLLDVELVEKVPEQSEGKDGAQGKPPEQEKSSKKPENPEPGQQEAEKKPAEGDKSDKTSEKGSEEKTSEQQGEAEGAEGGGQGPKTTVKSTGQKAFDDEAFRRIADLVATDKEEVLAGLVNVNTAPYEVLACLPGLDEPLAKAIVRERDGLEEGFTTTADLLDVDGMSMDVFKKVCPHVSARSDVFSVRSFGVLGVGDYYCCASAVIDRTEDTAQIKYWREPE